MTAPILLNNDNIGSFLSDIDNIFTDCDGVLWSTNTLISDADYVLNKLRSKGKKIFYITNNSTKSRESLVEKCEKLGFIASEDECITSSYIVALYLKQINFQKKVYIIGSSGITNELEKVGIEHTGVGNDILPENIMSLESTVKLDPDVGAVVVGFDQYFNIPKIMKAASYLLDPNCLFIGTNRDEKFPISNKNLIFPGTGVYVKAVETACHRTADIIGKPHPRNFEILQVKYDLDPKRSLMIGDRCSTDILFGKNCGMKTLFVESGINTLDEVMKWKHSCDPEENRLVPDYYLPSLGHMKSLLSDNLF